jgi:hypothetical protein
MLPPMIVPFGPGDTRDWINAVLIQDTEKVWAFVLFEVQPAKPECLCGLAGPFWNFAFHVSYGMP